jgi:hypothetical protein
MSSDDVPKVSKFAPNARITTNAESVSYTLVFSAALSAPVASDFSIGAVRHPAVARAGCFRMTGPIRLPSRSLSGAEPWSRRDQTRSDADPENF